VGHHPADATGADNQYTAHTLPRSVESGIAKTAFPPCPHPIF